MLENNLFNYATSELSQDAFLCWLISFAYEEAQTDDLLLKKCAEDLICMFAPGLEDSTFELTNIQRQYKHIDILLTIMAGGKEYKVIIEDKVFTNEHDDQLERYHNTIEGECKERDIYRAYYITGFQSDTSNIEKAGYTIVDRRQMLDLMERYKGRIKNQIFLDYYAFWDAFEKDAKSFETNPAKDWDWKQVYGCFEQLAGIIRKEGGWAGFDYVANPAGGFYGFWFGRQNCQIMEGDAPYKLYLQLEFVIGDPKATKLCLKMSAESDAAKIKQTRTGARDHLVYDKDWAYRLKSFNFDKPSRLGNGSTMTIGIYNKEDKEIFTDYNELKSVLAQAFGDYTKLLVEEYLHIQPSNGVSDTAPI